MPTDYHILLSLVADGRSIAFIPRSLQAIKRSGIVYKELAERDQPGIGVALAYQAGERSEMIPWRSVFLTAEGEKLAQAGKSPVPSDCRKRPAGVGGESAHCPPPCRRH